MSINENKEPEFEMWFDETTGKWEKIPYTPKPLPLSPSQTKTTRPEEKSILITPEMQPKPAPVPTLENTPTVEELAGQAQVYLRDLIICCQFALDQEPNWPPVIDPLYRRPIDRRRDIKWLIPHTESILRVAMSCNNSATLGILAGRIDGIERQIRTDIHAEGSLPRRNDLFKEVLTEMADWLYVWGKAVDFRARLLVALDPAKQKALLEKQQRFLQREELPEFFDYTPAFFANRFECTERHVRARLEKWLSDARGPQISSEIKEGNRWKLSKEQALRFEKFYWSQSTKKPKNKP